ncbi:hypothetical protein EWM64_g1158 [Hericium alpestre]|uniref:Chitin synthase n=1 Tax=Hericium alpestre TaxID=135208 RepID=A0A4Z0A9A7_9AGAM|nr:hypothetical protein EWM64_g1158 [Hericium alpestre]
MAYNQPHDPYGAHSTNHGYPIHDDNVAPGYPPAGGYGGSYPTHDPHQQDYPAQQSWDTKSAKSYQSSHNGSQAHLNPQYEMSQAYAAPVPSMPYAYQPDYPPQQQRGPPVLRHQASAAYSEAREKLLKRRSVRHVELQQGNLVFDVHVPTHIVPKGNTSEEMTKMRYTAATCDPDDFMRQQYSLRPYLYGRQTELFIVMTMYNEDEVLFVRTMNSVIKNIAHLCGRNKSKTWGPEGWRKVVVCVVSDGRNKMGCYQDGIAKDTVAGKDVTAHIFEYTSSVIVTEHGEVSTGACPVQIIFCLKEQNKKKLNSHRWFFNAFGPLIKPNVCILLDVGTKPTGTSIYELWKCFDKHSNVGGACGEICVEAGRACSLLFTSPLAASQNFEYKMSNILDKPLEIEFIYNAVNLLFTWTSLANFYLAFFFLVSSATSDSKNDPFRFLDDGAGKDVFEVFLKLYIALLFVVIVCSLGNRPQGSKWTYALCVVLFGLCNVITLWCTGYTIYLALPHNVAGWKDFPHLVETNKTLRELVISIGATYGLYFISSFMHFEPWHMFTSFLQYLFLLPSYVNILMMYAMCNLHDVTWGTKGDNGSAKDLGGAKKIKGEDGKELLEVELPTQREDVDQLWAAARSSLQQKAPEEKEHRDAATKQADRDRNSRTNVVLAWVGTNMAMIVVFTSTAFTNWVNKHVENTTDANFNPYLSFLFIALAGLSAIRFMGSFLYLVFRLFGF